MTPATDFAAAIRALVAPFVAADVAPLRLGRITLSDAQTRTVMHAHRVLERWGGALLGDPTGAGKTFVALALTVGHVRPVIVAPAALRTTWERAMRLADVAATFVSHETLSRVDALPDADIVIIDEAHHLRTTTTRRYRTAQRLCADRPVVLVSATPVHNRLADRDALFALFLGVDAADLDDAARASLVVRGALAPGPGPTVRSHPPHRIADVPAVVEAIAALPAPLPPSDGGTAPELWRIGLLRAWCSSHAALDATLRRAELRVAALVDAWAAGRTPSRAELAAWGDADGAQLAWAELVAPHGAVPTTQLDAARQSLHALRALRAMLPAHAHVDAARVAALRAIRDAHPGVPILACAQFGATVLGLGRLLRHDREVATLTAQRGRIASGPIARDAVLARFAPTAQGARAPSARERISLLIATDVVSEGLNLQDAGVVVHLDVPWTPARLAQRVGRLARPGSPHPAIHEYRLRAPRAANALLQMERRLAAKQRAADAVHDAAESARSVRERLVQLAALHPVSAATTDAPVIAAAEGHAAGILALVGGSVPRLVASLDGRHFSDEPRAVATLLDTVLTAVPASRTSTDDRLVRRLLRWIAHDRARQVAMTARPTAARAHRSTLAASQHEVATAPSHLRASVATRETARFAAVRSWPQTVTPSGLTPHLSVAIIIRIARSPFP